MSHNKVLSNILFFLISFSISILTTCQKDPISSANPEDTYTLISTETIDNDGGEIIADESIYFFLIICKCFNILYNYRIFIRS